MGKLPSIQFYPGDWRKAPDIQALDYETRGIWFEILLLMHESEERGRLILNGQAMPRAALAKILGLDEAKVEQTVNKLLSYGVASVCQVTGALMCRRMCKDEYLRSIRAEAGRIGGKQKQNKSLSKRQNFKQNRPPSSSSSSSNSPSEKELPTWLNKDLWQKYKEHRTQKKAPLLDYPEHLALETLSRLRSQGHDPERVIKQSIERGWKGLFGIDSEKRASESNRSNGSNGHKEIDHGKDRSAIGWVAPPAWTPWTPFADRGKEEPIQKTVTSVMGQIEKAKK